MTNICQQCNKEAIKPFPSNLGSEPQYLVSIFMPMCERNDEKYNEILDFLDAENNTYAEAFYDRIKEAELKYGENEVDQAFIYQQLCDTIGKKAVCRYCAGWDDTYA